MCERLEDLMEALSARVRALDAATIRADDALTLVEMYSKVERLAIAGRTIAAGRVQQTRAWRATGAASAAAWMADRTGSTIGYASATLNTAVNIKRSPEVREALVEGRLSHIQASEISAAAAADPDSAPDLLQLAEREPVSTLREKCRDVKAAAAGDEDANERIRRSRYAKTWNDPEGAVRLDSKFAPDDGARLVAVMVQRARILYDEAVRAGHREPMEAFMADALVSLLDGKGAPNTVVHVHVSQTAWERGHTVAGETCRVEGVAPISVAAAQRMAAKGVVKIIQTDGADVTRVAHTGRAIPVLLRTALEARDRTCVVPGCNRRHQLEIDHIVPFAQGGATSLENLARLCRWHHAQKTHHGWRLGGRPGAWTWERGSQTNTPATDRLRGSKDAGAGTPAAPELTSDKPPIDVSQLREVEARGEASVAQETPPSVAQETPLSVAQETPPSVAPTERARRDATLREEVHPSHATRFSDASPPSAAPPGDSSAPSGERRRFHPDTGDP